MSVAIERTSPAIGVQTISSKPILEEQFFTWLDDVVRKTITNENEASFLLHDLKKSFPQQTFLWKLLPQHELNQKLAETLRSYNPSSLFSNVQSLLDLGADVNYKDKDGFPIIRNLIRSNNPDIAEVETAKLLIEHDGIDVNPVDVYQMTFLHYVRNKEIAELLIQKGAKKSINARDINKQTPLHVANNKNIAEILIREGAEVNVEDTFEHTPLYYHATKKPDIAKLLVDKGGKFNDKDLVSLFAEMGEMKSSMYRDFHHLGINY